jgi:hypothetical protein
VIKTPWLTGPVKRCSKFLSIGFEWGLRGSSGGLEPAGSARRAAQWRSPPLDGSAEAGYGFRLGSSGMSAIRSLPAEFNPSPQASFCGLRTRRAPLQIPPRPISNLVHRALRFGEERKDRVDVDGILDEAQRHIDTSSLRALG